jgi:hypothetical protein
MEGKRLGALRWGDRTRSVAGQAFGTTPRVDVLVHGFNIAHRKAAQEVFPAAAKALTLIVAFTATRWDTLEFAAPAPSLVAIRGGDHNRVEQHQEFVEGLDLLLPKRRLFLAQMGLGEHHGNVGITHRIAIDHLLEFPDGLD